MRRPILTILCTAALIPMGFTGSAGSQSEIVIRGSEAGTHLRLSIDGSRLLVSGHLAAGLQAGCRPIRFHGAICPLANAGGITIETGSASDKVEVLDPLPVPLTAYLGGGSDKLIGNGEPDTCYPQGTKRNRCIGEGGRDICISGPVNTDCVGGPGGDYCETGLGSDGCWGGPGNDTCLMGKGKDGCHGEGGNDRLFGEPGADRLYGGPGKDYCDGEPGAGRSAECETGPG